MSETETIETIFTTHPAAELFPMLSEDELHELTQSVKLHGLREKIMILPDPDTKGHFQILDGRNRFAALKEAGISEKDILEKHSKLIDLKPLKSTAEEYVAMANLERRNLNRQQRKELAGKLAIMIQEAQKNKPRDEQIDALSSAAKAAGVSRRTAATSAGQQRGRSTAGPGTKSPNVLPGVANAQLGKLAGTLDRLGHNWPMGLLVETKENCEKVVAKLNTLIEKRAAADAAADAADAAQENQDNDHDENEDVEFENDILGDE